MKLRDVAIATCRCRGGGVAEMRCLDIVLAATGVANGGVTIGVAVTGCGVYEAAWRTEANPANDGSSTAPTDLCGKHIDPLVACQARGLTGAVRTAAGGA